MALRNTSTMDVFAETGQEKKGKKKNPNRFSALKIKNIYI